MTRLDEPLRDALTSDFDTYEITMRLMRDDRTRQGP